jgi:hypothetical protein
MNFNLGFLRHRSFHHKFFLGICSLEGKGDVGDDGGDLTPMEQQDDKGGKASLWPLDVKHIVGPFHWRSICYYMLVYLGVLFRYVCQNLVL